MAKAKEDTPGQEIDVRAAAGEIVSQNQQAMQSFVEWLTERATTTDEDQFDVMAAIIADILKADNLADALREQSAASAKDLIGVPLMLHGFEIREGSFEESTIGFYAALTMSRPGVDGTRVVTCGGMKVLARLMKISEFGEWPVLVTFTSRETSKGYTVLDLVSPTI
jgi:hypothetical protein